MSTDRFRETFSTRRGHCEGGGTYRQTDKQSRHTDMNDHYTSLYAMPTRGNYENIMLYSTIAILLHYVLDCNGTIERVTNHMQLSLKHFRYI